MGFLANRLRDRMARFLIAEKEADRMALRMIIRDESHSPLLRLKAQLALHKFSRYTRPSSTHTRCIESGKARAKNTSLFGYQGGIGAFRLSKIVFRDWALAGHLPGVKKAVW
ncbi:40S ribosomal protein mrp2, mitochondrial [Irineochytrium annulatum]|nr:40S ribosomal protein mrp2, mitochondrial [Irineochytrium annulatum]